MNPMQALTEAYLQGEHYCYSILYKRNDMVRLNTVSRTVLCREVVEPADISPHTPNYFDLLKPTISQAFFTCQGDYTRAHSLTCSILERSATSLPACHLQSTCVCKMGSHRLAHVFGPKQVIPFSALSWSAFSSARIYLQRQSTNKDLKAAPYFPRNHSTGSCPGL